MLLKLIVRKPRKRREKYNMYERPMRRALETEINKLVSMSVDLVSAFRQLKRWRGEGPEKMAENRRHPFRPHPTTSAALPSNENIFLPY